MYARILLVLVVGCALTAGCSSRSRSGSNVTGKVTHNGNPVAGARVVFTDGKETAGLLATGPSAVTDEDGEYALVGVPPGNYKIVVYKLVPKQGAVLPEDMDLVQIEASGLGVHTLPRKYSTPATTTLVAQVDSGANTADFKLTGQ
jgi:hypothetical protein